MGTIEKYTPRKGGDTYRRERKYLYRDGKRAAFYVRYIGKNGTIVGNGKIDTAGEIKDIDKRIEKLNAEAKQYSPDDLPTALRKKLSIAYTKRDILEMQKIADEKGSPLDKLERGFFESHQAKSYAELERYINVYVEEEYKGGSGLAKIKSKVKEYGEVDVSTTTIKKRLIASGVYESRPFGHERKVSVQEIELQNKLQQEIILNEMIGKDIEAHISKIRDRLENRAQTQIDDMADVMDRKGQACTKTIHTQNEKIDELHERNAKKDAKISELHEEIARLKN